ncbi:MAG: NusG domain II-containing protein, partial [Firmicutes bacterium]|nr:NusG domain II-containing protein [Bacillota bacterium]
GRPRHAAEAKIPHGGREADGLSGRLDTFMHKAKSPWRLSILFAMAVPLFPEYIAPVLAVLSLLTAAVDARRCGRRLKIQPLGWVLAAFILYSGIGVLYSRTTIISLGTWLMWVVMYLLYVAMVNVLSDRHRFDAALFVMSVMAGIVGGIACVQYIANALLDFSLPWCVWQRLDDLVYRYFPMPLNLGPGAMRACSTFNNPNILGEYLAMVFPFVVYYAFVGRRTRARLGCRVCLLLAAGGIAFSFSRGSYLALVTVAVVLCVTNVNKIMLILLSLSSVVVIIPESVLARLFSIKDTDTDASIGERLDIWKICIDAIGEKPVLGYGPGVQNSWDIIIAGGIWFFYSAGAEKGKGVEITVDGESKAFLPLGEDDSIRIDTDGGYNVITVKDGEVTVSEADCRDQICVEHKKIRKTGETIVCLPHKLVVTVTGDKPGDFDAVVM